jgi:leucyl-tRNA synthetase
MSKSLGNVINPDEIVKTYGADTLRVYEMFMGPFNQSVAWSTESIIGSRRFLEKVWKIGMKVQALSNTFAQDYPASQRHHSQKYQTSALARLLHKTIKKVGEDIESMSFNTAISTMMILATEMDKSGVVEREDYKKFLQILAPFAPHMAEELWKLLGEKKSINISTWPKYDESAMKEEELKVVVQVNGKVRAEIMVQADEDEESVKQKALKNETILKFVSTNQVKKIIYVKGRLLNIVV